MRTVNKSNIRIGWILQSTRDNAGARIHGFNIHDAFIKQGVDSEIVYIPESGYSKKFDIPSEEVKRLLKKKYDIIAMTMPNSGDRYYKFVDNLHETSSKLVCIATDNYNKDYASVCDHLIVVADFLKTEMPSDFHSKTTVVTDGYEHDGTKHKVHSNKKEIELVFTSNNVFNKFPQINKLPENVSLKIIGPPPERVDKFKMGKLFSETPYKFKYVVWNLDTFQKEILRSDVAVIPYPKSHIGHDYIKRKSSNRLIMFMSYGIPTIVSPNPEYEKILKHGINGFIANNEKEWIKYITLLRDKPKTRRTIGARARKDVLGKFSYKNQAEKYLKVFIQTTNTLNTGESGS